MKTAKKKMNIEKSTFTIICCTTDKSKYKKIILSNFRSFFAQRRKQNMNTQKRKLIQRKLEEIKKDLHTFMRKEKV